MVTLFIGCCLSVIYMYVCSVYSLLVISFVYWFMENPDLTCIVKGWSGRTCIPYRITWRGFTWCYRVYLVHIELMDLFFVFCRCTRWRKTWCNILNKDMLPMLNFFIAFEDNKTKVISQQVRLLLLVLLFIHGWVCLDLRLTSYRYYLWFEDFITWFLCLIFKIYAWRIFMSKGLEGFKSQDLAMM